MSKRERLCAWGGQDADFTDTLTKEQHIRDGAADDQQALCAWLLLVMMTLLLLVLARRHLEGDTGSYIRRSSCRSI